ncbi:glycosyltransferase [Methylobacterium persicinum]|uniref:Glycosyltransferase involved in cell wall biosynthesis n=1 Tax=Methylobacterium persicinum TaxID=374426 RepID=A0ABU0HQA9_9HYPH|nr:glycosyltransferase [Methylobacterium persicinum]MDQ0443699.1 glycosyltransferase involved in cell wall biosynthesis [Methylobacterium persicinum]GJE40174.1 UDP-Gal:alpha-D-GlcNAc-diphosphoundecaprenol beta-1,3-galactosyltransferase [Methylobacterium persicinum]
MVPDPYPDRPTAPDVCVLISTYAGETASRLGASLASLREQTLRPGRVVLVVDGPVDPEQEATIAAFAAAGAPPLDLVRIPRNVGLAGALNAGLERCRGAWIMRMDSDDLCMPDRLEIQMAYAWRHPGIDVVTAWSEEFFEDGTAPQIKVSPTRHAAVARAMRWRNVLVHPTVLVRTEVLRRVGGYRSRYGLLEDYDLFVRLIQAGAQFHVIPRVLVRVRSSLAQKERRGGLAYCFGEMRFRFACYRSGFLGLRNLFGVTPLYLVFRLVSGPLKRRFYSLARA